MGEDWYDRKANERQGPPEYVPEMRTDKTATSLSKYSDHF